MTTLVRGFARARRPGRALSPDRGHHCEITNSRTDLSEIHDELADIKARVLTLQWMAGISLAHIATLAWRTRP